MAVDMFEQAGAREGIGLIDFVADLGQVCTAPNQFAGHVISTRARAGILEGAGIGRDGREKTIGDWFGDRPLGNGEETEEQFAGGRLARRDPIEIGVSSIALVVIDIDEELAIGDAWSNGAEALKAGGVSG